MGGPFSSVVTGRRRSAWIAGSVMLFVGCALPSRAVEGGPVEAVAHVRAVRGFQGLYEWVPGADGGDGEWTQGGPLSTCGTRIDLLAVAREEGVRARDVMREDVFVLTTLRSIHDAQSITVRFSSQERGRLPRAVEEVAEVVAQDPAVNLALLKVPRAAPRVGRGGLALARSTPAPGQVLWRARYVDDVVWVSSDIVRSYEVFVEGDPFWESGIPALRPGDRVLVEESGAPMVDPSSGRLLGLLANGERRSSRGGRPIVRGPVYGIPVEILRSFLRTYLRSQATDHGSLGPEPPVLATVGPELAELLTLEEPKGLVVLEDWTGPDGARLDEGDVVLEAGGRRVGPGGSSLEGVAFESKPGTLLQLQVLREGRILEFPIRVSTRPPGQGRPGGTLEFGGAWFQDLPPTIRHPRYSCCGAVVAHVRDGTPADAAQLRFGERVHEVFGGGRHFHIASVADLERALDAVRAGPDYRGEIGFRVTHLLYPFTRAAIRVLREGTAERLPQEGGM